MNQAKNPTRQRIALIGLASLFIVPVLVAWYLIKFGQDWLPEGSAAHGELIHPAQPITPFVINTLFDAPIDLSFFDGKWTMVSVAGKVCDERCEKMLYSMRQVRLAQGTEMKRVQRLMVVTEQMPINLMRAAFKTVLQQHQGTSIGIGKPPALQVLLSQLLAANESGDVEGSIYIVDPLGNLVMRYRIDDSLKGMAKDLTRLLKASQIG